MPTMTGTVTIVQETRFQLTDEHGVSHLFLLGHGSMAEPDQLAPLQSAQARVRVRYVQPRNIIGMVAKSIEVDDMPT